MTVAQVDIVDAIGVDKTSGQVVLTVLDDLEWSSVADHLTTLQDKINRYLAFIESGELFRSYPDAEDRDVVINVLFRFEPPAEGKSFLDRAAAVIRAAGFDLRHQWRAG